MYVLMASQNSSMISEGSIIYSPFLLVVALLWSQNNKLWEALRTVKWHERSNINKWGQRKGYDGHTSHMMELLADSYVEPRSDPQTEIMEKKDLFETKANGRSDGKAKEKFL
ncbi:hypothetical protein Tco_1040275 [Tanacetum coccineum]